MKFVNTSRHLPILSDRRISDKDVKEISVWLNQRRLPTSAIYKNKRFGTIKAMGKLFNVSSVQRADLNPDISDGIIELFEMNVGKGISKKEGVAPTILAQVLLQIALLMVCRPAKEKLKKNPTRRSPLAKRFLQLRKSINDFETEAEIFSRVVPSDLSEVCVKLRDAETELEIAISRLEREQEVTDNYIENVRKHLVSTRLNFRSLLFDIQKDLETRYVLHQSAEALYRNLRYAQKKRSTT